MPTTYDVAAFQQSTLPLTQALVVTTNNGVLITGIRKLAQRFIIELMTEKGTMRYRRRGTSFVTDAKAGLLRTEADVYSSFALAMLDLKANLAAEDNLGDYPADEKLESAEILKLVLSPGSLSMTINIVSQAGGTSSLTVPVTFILNPGA